MDIKDFKSNSKLGFVIGNGESRQGFDLKQLRKFGPIYGCNALYRDFIPDLLIAGDSPMIREIEENYRGHNFFRVLNESYLELPLGNNSHPIKLPSLVGTGTNWYAGIVAAWLMCHINTNLETVHLVGFDMYGKGPKGRYINNLYKGTLNYAASDAEQEPLLRIDKHVLSFHELVFKVFPHIKFLRVGNKSDPFPELWKGRVEFVEFKDL